ncbi:MAG: uracil-DNA glycosylase [Gemmatimonadota bacterium]
MADPRELVRRYLLTRISLGDPELFLVPGGRAEAVGRLREIAAGGFPGPRGEAGPLGDEGVRARATAVEGGPEEPSSTRTPRSTEGRASAARGKRTPKSEPEVPISIGEAQLARLAREARGDEIAALGDLATVRAVALRCTRCALHEMRAHVVFADGSEGARVMCIGEAPGAVEDETGLPFVGRAGKLMDRLLLAVGFRREEVYICNVLKCRPPANRNPSADEIERCSPFLLRQVELVRPEVIVAFGSFAAQTLIGTRESIGRLRGRTHVYRGVPLVVTYHPAALLRNPGWTRPTWEDLQLVRRIADGESVSPASGRALELGLGL